MAMSEPESSPAVGLNGEPSEPELEEHMDLVRQVALALRRRLGNGVVELDELEADGFEALVKAMRDYDPAKGSLVPYIVVRCRGAMIDGVRRRMWISRNDLAAGAKAPPLLSLDDRLGGDLRFEDVLVDPEATTADEAIERATLSECRAVFRKLPRRYQRVARERFLHGRSQREVAAAEGVSPTTIAQVETKIRRHLGQLGIEENDQPLTSKELNVLRLAAEGASTDETAKHLRKTQETIKSHRSRIISKLRARNMMNAIAIGYERGLL